MALHSTLSDQQGRAKGSPLWRLTRRTIGLTCLAGALWVFAIWPPPSWYRSHWPAETAFMEIRRREPARATKLPRGTALSSTRRPIRQYRPVSLDSVAPAMPAAVMIGEDSRFLTHHGIDYIAILQALGYQRQNFDWGAARDRSEALALVPKFWSRRSALRGASTITQQLAKNLYLSASRNPLRKAKEAVTAYRIEGAMSKQRIMELYLNVVELGDEVWGVEAGSQKYFGRAASQLSRTQAASLAGSLPFPLRSNPGYRPGRMAWRRDLILRRMQGEQVEVPRVEEESPAEPTDSLAPRSQADTTSSSTAERDTVPPAVTPPNSTSP